MRIQDRLYAAKIFFLFFFFTYLLHAAVRELLPILRQSTKDSISFNSFYYQITPFLLPSLHRVSQSTGHIRTARPAKEVDSLPFNLSISFLYLRSTYNSIQRKAERKPPDPHTSHDTRVFCVMTYFSLKVTYVCERVSRHENARAQPTKKRYRVATLV